MINYARRSLDGVWVGDCIGNLGQLYFCHDILRALESGIVKFGGQLDKFQNQFQYSDDTEECVVLYNHIMEAKGEGADNYPLIDQDKLAMGFATRYMTRDPDGEIYGYVLNTRKVLKDIYEGVPWTEANKFIKPKAEGMPSHIDSLVDSLSKGKDMKAAMHEVNLVLERQKKGETGRELQGSCGNGSAMRVPPLGAYLATDWGGCIQPQHLTSDGFYKFEKKLIVEAVRQAEVTHCHPEGVAGSIAATLLSYLITEKVMLDYKHPATFYYTNLLRCVPRGQVWDGIMTAAELPMDMPVGLVIQKLGNGTHVTCQDTVPFCCYMAIKAIMTYPKDEMFEKTIIETSMAFGDVDTNCAIVGGIIANAGPPPEKWVKFCQPMDDVVDTDIPQTWLDPSVDEEINRLVDDLEGEV